jgi:hypothetical protein
MMKQDNEPDDIRMYDHDERSPYYDSGWRCPVCDHDEFSCGGEIDHEGDDDE